MFYVTISVLLCSTPVYANMSSSHSLTLVTKQKFNLRNQSFRVLGYHLQLIFFLSTLFAKIRSCKSSFATACVASKFAVFPFLFLLFIYLQKRTCDISRKKKSYSSANGLCG